MFRKFLKILRLPHQVIAIVPFLYGALDAHLTNTSTLFTVGLGLTAISISFFIINSYVDFFDTDKNNVRNEKGFNFSRHQKLTFSIWLFLSLIGSTIFLVYGLWLPLLLLLFFGNFYSVPPLRFKSRFPWDMIAPLLAWGAIPYSLAFSLQHLPYEQVINIASVSFALFGIPMQGIHYLADAEADEKAGVKNWCTVLGYHNFLRVIDKFAIAALLGFTYLIYRHERWWYYPVILACVYELLIIGYARAAIYHPTLQKLHSIANRSYSKGVFAFILILIFQIWALSRI